MPRKVLLPKEIEGRLIALTPLTQEVDGILLYRKRNDYCSVEALFMTGVGSVGHVQAEPERVEVANEFFKRNSEYQFIKFHTHSRGTIERFGQYYARHFSQGDIDGMQEHLRADRDFMAMLVTPETKLLCGIDNPTLLVVNGFRGYQSRSQAVSRSLNSIAKNLGYDISRLQATTSQL